MNMRQAAAFCMSCGGWIKAFWEPSQDGAVIVQTSNDQKFERKEEMEEVFVTSNQDSVRKLCG